jgi:para-aminobenzoate synthetase/4-amino-4-deoxychorismate lyase
MSFCLVETMLLQSAVSTPIAVIPEMPGIIRDPLRADPRSPPGTTRKGDGPGRIIRHKDRHLARLQRSCRDNHYPFDRELVEQRLQQFIAEQPDVGECKLRLLYDAQGIRQLTAESYQAPQGELSVRLVTEPMLAFPPEQFRHKFIDSPLREFYVAFPEGPYDHVFMNSDGIITEGTRTNVYIEIDGRLITSPVEAGLLPGTYRDWLIEQGCVVQPITQSMLHSAQRCFISNALIGKREVRVIDA